MSYCLAVGAERIVGEFVVVVGMRKVSLFVSIGGRGRRRHAGARGHRPRAIGRMESVKAPGFGPSGAPRAVLPPQICLFTLTLYDMKLA